MKRTLKLLILLLAVSVMGFTAESRDLQWDRIRREAAQIKTIRANFVQEKHLKILSRPLISKGLFYYERPGSLRWEYLSPIRRILIMHGGRVDKYTYGQNGFRKDSGLSLQAMQVVMEEMGRWIGGRFTDSPEFSASLDSCRKIVLRPRNKALAAIISRIELVPSDRPGVIQSVTIYEGRDSFTRIIFKNVRVNEDLKDDLFHFEP